MEEANNLVEEKTESRLVFMTEEDFKKICTKAAEIGAREAMNRLAQERKKDNARRNDRRLRNTKLLLRNYRALKGHIENSVFARSQMCGSAREMLEAMMQGKDEELIIESIQRTAEKTAIMVAHIDAMIGIYEAYCEKAGNPVVEKRRYEVLHDTYFIDPPLTVEEIADKQSLSKQGVYKDLGIATERLSALIFGVDGMNVQ